MIHNLSYLCICWLYAKTLIFIDHSIWLQLWQSGSWWLHTIFLWWNPRSCQNLQFWWWATFGKSKSKYLHQVPLNSSKCAVARYLVTLPLIIIFTYKIYIVFMLMEFQAHYFFVLCPISILHFSKTVEGLGTI